jgi:hypothetical protein
VRRLREDVHIHAPASEVYARVAGLAHSHDWLPPVFADLEVGARSVAFALALPLRTERTRLAVAADEPPAYIEFTAVDGSRGIELLSWGLNAEGPHDVHVTLEAGYEPSAGPIGWLLEETMQRPARRQAFRDALWRLKLLAEGRE